MENQRENDIEKKKTDLNLRPLLFCAIGLAFGIFLYGKIAFGGLSPSDFLFIGLFLLLALRPLSWKRLAAISLALLIPVGAGALGIFLYDKNFRAEPIEDQLIVGTVRSVSHKSGQSYVLLGNLVADGEELGGNCRLYLSNEDVLPADILAFHGSLKPVASEGTGLRGAAQYYYSQNIRFTAQTSEFAKNGESRNPFLRFNRFLYQMFTENMRQDEAGVAYALLTGSSGIMDEGISESARRGGIAHIFAVSGLHIGILFSAVYFVCAPLKKFRIFPASAAAFCYCALCNFTVSSMRAFVMCSVMGSLRALGRKYDYLNSLSLAAVLTLLFSPQQWFSWGFRLSYGACAGLGLFSGSFSRLFQKIRLPRPLAGYLSGYCSIQLVLFPMQLEMSGYFPVLGILSNALAVPLLPPVFLLLFLFSFLSVLIPPISAYLLLVPEGALSAFCFLLSGMENAFVIKGFSLGAGVTVIFAGCLLLSERVRGSLRVKAVAAACLAVLFSVSLVLQNAVFSGCKVEAASENGKSAALFSTRDVHVLVIGGEVTQDFCEDFLNRRYGGTLDAVVVLSSRPVSAIHSAACLNAQAVYAEKFVQTDSPLENLRFSSEFECGGISFRYFGGEKLLVLAEDVAVEVDFTENAMLGSDLFLSSPQGELKYFLKGGKILS